MSDPTGRTNLQTRQILPVSSSAVARHAAKAEPTLRLADYANPAEHPSNSVTQRNRIDNGGALGGCQIPTSKPTSHPTNKIDNSYALRHYYCHCRSLGGDTACFGASAFRVRPLSIGLLSVGLLTCRLVPSCCFWVGWEYGFEIVSRLERRGVAAFLLAYPVHLGYA